MDADLTFREPAPIFVPIPGWTPPERAPWTTRFLRGLLLELPPKGATLQGQWLDAWFEAARSILELLYRFEDTRD